MLNEDVRCIMYLGEEYYKNKNNYLSGLCHLTDDILFFKTRNIMALLLNSGNDINSEFYWKSVALYEEWKR